MRNLKRKRKIKWSGWKPGKTLQNEYELTNAFLCDSITKITWKSSVCWSIFFVYKYGIYECLE